MVRRGIGQEQLWGERVPRPGNATLDDVLTLVDWRELDQLPASPPRPRVNRAGRPWLCSKPCCSPPGHDLSDVRLAEALDDRASFRRFCGFSTHEPTPERTTFVCFRAELVHLGLDRALFAAVTRQLDQRGVVVRTGTLSCCLT